MITFLFWNLNQKPLQESIVRLAYLHDVDVLMFAECLFEPASLLESLNQDKRDLYEHSFGNCEKIHVFTGFPQRFISPVHERDHLTIRHVNLFGKTDI